MTRVLIPRSDNISAKKINPTDWGLFFGCRLILNQSWDGLCISAGTGLAVDVAIGTARVNGLHLCNTTACTCAVTCLTACCTTSIYMQICNDPCGQPDEWTFGTTAGDCAFLIGTATTDCANVTSVCNAVRNTNAGASAPTCSMTYPSNTAIMCFSAVCCVPSVSSTGCTKFSSVIEKGCCQFAGFYDDQTALDGYWDNFTDARARAIFACNHICICEINTTGAERTVVVLPFNIMCSWVIRFKVVTGTNVRPSCTADVQSHIGAFSNAACSDVAWITWNIRMDGTGGNRNEVNASADNLNFRSDAVNQCTFCCTTGTGMNCTTKFIEIIRTTTCAASVEMFTDACFMCTCEKKCVACINSCISCLNVIGYRACCATSGANAQIQEVITCFEFWCGRTTVGDCMTTDQPSHKCFMLDTNNRTRWNSASEACPTATFTISCTDDQRLSNAVVNLGCENTVTVFDVDVKNSCTCVWVNKTRVCIAGAAADTDLFFRIPDHTEDYSQIRLVGKDTSSKIFSIHYVRTRTETDLCWDRKHGHQVWLTQTQTAST